MASSSKKCDPACFTREGCIMPDANPHKGPGRPSRYPKCIRHNKPIHKWADGTLTAEKPKYNNANRASIGYKIARVVPRDEDEHEYSLRSTSVACFRKRAQESEATSEHTGDSRAKKARLVICVHGGANQQFKSLPSEPTSPSFGFGKPSVHEELKEPDLAEQELANDFIPTDPYQPVQLLFDIGGAAMTILEDFIRLEEQVHTDMTSYRDYLEILESNQPLRENYKDLCRKHMAVGPVPFDSSTFWEEFQSIKIRALDIASTRQYEDNDPCRWNLKRMYACGPRAHLFMTLLGICERVQPL